MKKAIAIILSIILVMAITLPAAAVSSIAVKSLNLNNSKITMKVGGTYDLKVTFTPANTTQKLLTFSTSNKKIATIDNKGKITAVNKGNAVITVVSSSNKKVLAKCNVTVLADPLAKYAPNPKKTYDIVVHANQITPVDEANNWVFPKIDKDLNIKLHNFSVDNKPENLDIKIAAGDIPDVMRLTFAQFAKYATQGLLAEVPVDLIQKYNPTEIISLKTAVGDKPFTYSSQNGKNYGFVNLNINMQFETPIIWRDDLAKSAGITKTPTTLSELETALYAIVRQGQKTGKKIYGISDRGMLPIFGAFGGIPWAGNRMSDTAGMWELQGGKLAYSAVQPYMKDALALLTKWYKDGIIDPEFVLGENSKGYWGESQPFENGQIAMTNTGVWYHTARPVMAKGANMEPTDWSAEEPAFLKANPNGHYDYIKPPVGASGKSGTLHSTVMDGYVMAFSKKSVDADPGKLGKILQLSEYLNKDYAAYCLMWFGKEGISYKIDTTLNMPVAIDTDKKYSDINVLYPLIGANILFGYNYDAYLKGGGNDLLWAKKTFSYTTNYTNQKLFATPSESKYWGDLWKLQQEAYVSIITGDKPVSYFDDFVKQWNAQGGSTIVKEANDMWATMK